MKIITYVSSVADEAPEPVRACARIWLGADGFLPVTFHAADKHTARAKAQAHWDKHMAAELAKVDPARLEAIKARRIAAREKAAATRAAKAEPVGVAA